jgi:hypothetical protein
VGRNHINLVKGNGQSWCRRIQVAEKVTIAPRSQQDVMSKTVGGKPMQSASVWMTESRKIEPGICIARMVFDDDALEMPARVINLNDRPVKLFEDQFLGNLHPVEMETSPEQTLNRVTT